MSTFHESLRESRRRIGARIAVAVRDNRVALGFVLVWLAANAAVFSGEHRGLELFEVVTGLSRASGGWGKLYQPFTQFVVFGVVVSMVAANVTRKHRPEATARFLASRCRDHVVIIGHTHLGERIRDAMLETRTEVVVVDDDRARVEEILREEHPLVLGDPRDPENLEAAAIRYAKVVVIASDEVEVAVIAAREVRARNPDCELIVRCPDEDVGDVIARTYRARIVSTSRIVAKVVCDDAAKRGTRRAVVFGKNSIGRRVADTLGARGVSTTFVDVTEDTHAIAAAGVADAELIVIADDDLGKNLIRVDRIRDHAPNARIVCRAFHEDAAEILTRAPFKCTVLSSSRLALDALVREGAFRTVVSAPTPTRLPGTKVSRARA